MDNPRSRPQASISVPGLPPWMKNTLQKFMQEGQTHIKSVSSTLHKLGRPGTKSTATSTEASEPEPLDFRVKLEKQLQAWRENNQWVEPAPKIEVTVPKGSLCHLDATAEVGLPPDAVFDIVIDPDNKNVFKNIKEVRYRKILEDEGHRQLVEVEQAAIWRFLWWSGTISVRVFVEQDRHNHTVKFRLAKEGFMKKFEGSWKLEPLFVDQEACVISKPTTLEEYESCSDGKGRVASLIKLQQLVQPALVPPPPISWYVRGITARTTEMMVEDLQAEVKRIREGSIPRSLKSNEGNSQQIIGALKDSISLPQDIEIDIDDAEANKHQRTRTR